MLKKILAAVALVFVAFLAFVATRPSDFKYERSATINAPAGVVFAQLDDFHRWAGWSPWEKMDASMKKEFSGPASGVGSSYHWVGNNEVGEGRMTVVSEKADAEVVIKLEFLKPFQATNTTTLSLAPASPGTTVRWTMTGTNGFAFKAAGVFMNSEKMIGDDFEKGLASLKGIAEAEAAKQQAAAPAAAPAAPAEEAPKPD